MSMATAQAPHNQYLEAVDAHLTSVLDRYLSPVSLYDPVRYLFDAGGKRIRPLLVLLAAEACGSAWQPALPAAVAVELLHAFTLVHDDIMDRSALRRGRETVHVRWGDSVAILAGDVMMGIAMRELEQSARHSKQPMDVVSAFSTGLIDVCDGQALDLEFQTRHDVTEDQYIDMITKKTAKLLEMSVAIGATIADAPAPHIEALRAFARNLGIAFQLQDDLLDVTADASFGKTAGGDLVEGKRTWLVLAAQQRATAPEHVQIIERFFADGGIPPASVLTMRGVMNALGVLDDARAKVQTTTTAAFGYLEQLPASPARDRLADLAKQLMHRTT
jgi:geranylgeranyl diphosphate synthase type II